MLGLGSTTSWMSRQLGRAAAAVFFITFILLLCFASLFLRLDYGPMKVDRATQYVTNKINGHFGADVFSVGSLSMRRDNKNLLVEAENVDLRDENGGVLFTFPSAVAVFDRDDLLKGSLSPKTVRVAGASIKIERDENGNLVYLPRTNTDQVTKYESLDEILQVYAKQSGLDKFKRIEFVDSIIIYQNRSTGATFAMVDASVSAQRDGDVFEFQTRVGGENDSFSELGVLVSLRHRLNEEASDLKVQLENAWVGDFAGEFPGLEFLQNVEAPISGSLTAQILDSTQTSALSGAFQIGEGTIRKLVPGRPLKLENASGYFKYDLKDQKTSIEDLRVSSDLLRFVANGEMFFDQSVGESFRGISTDLDLSEIAVTDEDTFDAPQTFQSAKVQANYNLNTQVFDLETFVLNDHETFYEAQGQTWVSDGRTNNRYRLRIDQMQANRLKQLWPKWAIPKTRTWVTQNISDGRVVDLNGVIGVLDGRNELNLSFGFQDATARFLKFMPELKRAEGRGVLTEKRFEMTLSKGGITAPNGKPVDMAGSKIVIPNIAIRPAPGEISLVADAGLRSTLELLNVPKFKFMDQAGLATNFGNGKVKLAGQFNLPLIKTIKIKDVDFAVKGNLTNFQSSSLLKGHRLTSDNLKFSATSKGIDIAGKVAVDGNPSSIKWAMGFGAAAKNGSKLSASTTFSQKTLASFNVDLPKGTVSGAAKANLDVSLKKGKAPRFVLESNLVGAGLAISSLGWSKAKSKAGKLVVTGSFGETPEISKLDFSASGLSTTAKISLNSKGKLKQAVFSDLKVGNWLQTQAIVTPNGSKPNIILNGGRADIRRLPKSSSRNGGSIDVKLDRLTIQDGLYLTDLRTKLRPGQENSFSGNLNGAAPIAGVLRSISKGMEIEFKSKSAGQFFNAAGFLSTVRGGAMSVKLTPTGETNAYRGSMRIDRTRIKGNKPITELLNAMSVVGLVQQLNGEGIHFDTVRASFNIDPGNVHIRELSAVGASMGITVNGFYGANSNNVDFRGVVTPIYLLNGVFERLLGKLAGRSRGEGLFSFKYTMKGSAKKPNINVNPLSILTPGAFREIFNTPPPQPQN